ncbi:putative colanic acid biosynthesis acetyltransferase [Rhizobium sp. SGZ-381]|uniref:putative colanic acid biosynthesis acetyltransferase n=1 Tax=Rhizobium sp. SGZ-381 TaxID=3342800 RepID=UPI00366CA60D
MTAPLDAGTAGSKSGGPSFALDHRLTRAAWAVCWALLAAWTPPPLHGWRRLLLRLFGARIAPTAKVYGSARVWYPPNLTMDDHSCLGPQVNCYCMAPISLGRHALASQGAYLCAGTHDIDDPDFQLIVKPIRLGDGAWVAAQAFVGPGVTIGDHAVLGARGVLFRDLAAGQVAAGNPAQVLRARRISESPIVTEEPKL